MCLKICSKDQSKNGCFGSFVVEFVIQPRVDIFPRKNLYFPNGVKYREIWEKQNFQIQIFSGSCSGCAYMLDVDQIRN